MKYGAVVSRVCLLALGAAPFAAPAGATQPTSQPAAWITRDVEVNLQSLPKTYSCDDLWYRLHGILLAIGARQYMSITPYHCGRGATDGGRSPTLDLKFQILRALSAANARWADTRAVRTTVRLAPGEPKILDAGDCSLLEQLEGTLFAYLNVHVVSSDLQCSAPQAAGRFSLSVQVLAEKPASVSRR